MQAFLFNGKIGVTVECDCEVTDRQKALMVLSMEDAINSTIMDIDNGECIRLAAPRIHITEAPSKDQLVADAAYRLARKIRSIGHTIMDLMDFLEEVQSIDPAVYDEVVKKAA